jgi:8-oxo-dGTP pyrophosphatase MutT (NUDIX family)
MTEAIPHRTARVILASPQERVLLFRYHLPMPWGRAGWLTPGGMIEDGEIAAQTAARELHEETGLQVSPTGLGAAVAWNSGEWWSDDGTVFEGHDWYFFARAPTEHVDLSGQDEDERQDLLAHRWWAADELAATEELVFPVGLAELLTRLLTGDRPSQPLRLPWT